MDDLENSRRAFAAMAVNEIDTQIRLAKAVVRNLFDENLTPDEFRSIGSQLINAAEAARTLSHDVQKLAANVE